MAANTATPFNSFATTYNINIKTATPFNSFATTYNIHVKTTTHIISFATTYNIKTFSQGVHKGSKRQMVADGLSSLLQGVTISIVSLAPSTLSGQTAI